MSIIDFMINTIVTILFWGVFCGSWVLIMTIYKGDTKYKWLNKFLDTKIGMVCTLFGVVVVIAMIVGFELPSLENYH